MTGRHNVKLGRGASAREHETDAQYLQRIDGEIAEGLHDLATGNVVSAGEHGHRSFHDGAPRRDFEASAGQTLAHVLSPHRASDIGHLIPLRRHYARLDVPVQRHGRNHNLVQPTSRCGRMARSIRSCRTIRPRRPCVGRTASSSHWAHGKESLGANAPAPERHEYALLVLSRPGRRTRA